jgi:hypothetical protein
MKNSPIGKKLAKIRPMTKAELDDQCWPDKSWSKPLAMEFEDGTVVFATRDEEANGPGAFLGMTPDHRSFRIKPSF